MKSLSLISAAVLAITLSACSANPSRETIGTATGAVVGGAVGHVIGGGTLGTVGGAAAGAVIGKELGKK